MEEDVISIGWVAAPAGMAIDDFEVVEFLREVKGVGDEFEEATTKGMKTARTLRTAMRTDFRGKVVIPPRHAGGSVTILPMHDIPAFRPEAAKREPCDRILRKDKAVPEKVLEP